VKKKTQPTQLSRRELIRGSLVFGAGAILVGCRSRGGVDQTHLPDPLWPDQVPPKAATLPSNKAPATVNDPNIIPRSAWAKGGLRESGAKHAMNGVRRITIHHTAMDSTDLRSRSDVATMLERIRQEHLRRDSRFIDIGYHYIIDPSGNIWAGRSTNLQGAHVKDQNEHNLGICVMGNFEIQKPTRNQLSTLNGFVAEQMRRYNVHSTMLFTHRELGTSACPGINLQQIMQAARSRGGRFASL